MCVFVCMSRDEMSRETEDPGVLIGWTVCPGPALGTSLLGDSGALLFLLEIPK